MSVYVYVCICGCADDVVNGFRVYVHTASRHLKPNPDGGGRENGETRPLRGAAVTLASFGAALMHLANSPAPVSRQKLVG